jgi:hypothetical protein
MTGRLPEPSTMRPPLWCASGSSGRQTSPHSLQVQHLAGGLATLNFDTTIKQAELSAKALQEHMHTSAAHCAEEALAIPAAATAAGSVGI